MIITELSASEFKVIVKNELSTEHIVILDDKTHANLTDKKITKKELIELSFKFLLERESNTSILSKFKLEEISNYFPEYSKFLNEWCK